MSNISKALKKIQELRQESSLPKSADLEYLSDSQQNQPKNFLIITLSIGVISAIILSTVSLNLTLKNSDIKQMEAINLEKTIKAQEIRINDLVAAINKNQGFLANQTRDLNLRLKKENQDTQDLMNNLVLQHNAHYTELKNSIEDDKENINLLNKYINILNLKVKDISAKEEEVRSLLNPTTVTPATGTPATGT